MYEMYELTAKSRWVTSELKFRANFDEEMYLERYVSAIQVGNTGSKKMALKNGMQLEKVIEMEGKQVEIYVIENEIEFEEE